MRSLPEALPGRVGGRATRIGVVATVLAVAAAAAVAGHDASVTGLVVDGTADAANTTDGTVHVPADTVQDRNESVTIGAEDRSVCIGDCAGVATGD